MKRLSGGSFGLLFFAVQCCASAVAAEACPPSIQEQPSVMRAEEPWVVFTKPAERPLEQIALYLGAPEDPGTLVPDSTSVSNRVESVTWTLRPIPGDRHWIGCKYVGTSAVLLKELPPDTKRCVVQYGLLTTGRRQGVKSVRCE